MTEDMAADLFSAAYGRLMNLAGRALHDGIDKDLVGAAARGRAQNMGPTLTQISRQRIKVNRAVTACKQAGISRERFVSIGKAARKQAEGEWEVKIPIVEE